MKPGHKFLHICQEWYHRGEPLISDAEFDALADKYNFNQLGYSPPSENRVKLPYKMYSLQKVFDDEKYPSVLEGHELIETPKLDGAAISLTYQDGMLVGAATRGDGEVGEEILEHVIEGLGDHVPLKIEPVVELMQISGEVVTAEEVDNPRNYVSGALHRKDTSDLWKAGLEFFAYGVYPYPTDFYMSDMDWLTKQNFLHVAQVANGTYSTNYYDRYPQDGKVLRVADNTVYEKLGYTSKHPRGAFALKKRSDVVTKETKLLDVVWQVGHGGKVTPVAIFEPIVIDGATLQRATLHNAGFLENLDVEIGDTLLITRSGGIIPKVVGNL